MKTAWAVLVSAMTLGVGCTMSALSKADPEKTEKPRIAPGFKEGAADTGHKKFGPGNAAYGWANANLREAIPWAKKILQAEAGRAGPATNDSTSLEMAQKAINSLLAEPIHPIDAMTRIEKKLSELKVNVVDVGISQDFLKKLFESASEEERAFWSQPPVKQSRDEPRTRRLIPNSLAVKFYLLVLFSSAFDALDEKPPDFVDLGAQLPAAKSETPLVVAAFEKKIDG